MQYSAQVNNQQSLKLADPVEDLPFGMEKNEDWKDVEIEARSAGRARESEHALKNMTIRREPGLGYLMYLHLICGRNVKFLSVKTDRLIFFACMRIDLTHRV